VGLRFVTTLAIASARAARYPENAPYILRNCARSAAGLRALARLDTPALLAELESL
jgi:hydroxylysine kinase